MGRFDKVKKYEDFGFLFLWKMMMKEAWLERVQSGWSVLRWGWKERWEFVHVAIEDESW